MKTLVGYLLENNTIEQLGYIQGGRPFQNHIWLWKLSVQEWRNSVTSAIAIKVEEGF